MGLFDFLKPKASYAELANKAEDLTQAGDFEAALTVWHRVLGLYPKSIGGHSNLGKVLYLSGKKEEALGWFQKAAALGPKATEVQRNYGVGLMECGRLAEAEEQFVRAYNLDPNNMTAYYNMAEVCEMQDKYADAVKFYTQVLDHAQPASPLWLESRKRIEKVKGRQHSKNNP